MQWETLPNRRKRPRPEPRLRLYDERHGYLNVSALDALSSNGEPCMLVVFQRDDLGRIAISPAATDDDNAFSVGRKGVVNVSRLTELIPGATFPVSVRLVRQDGERRLFLAGKVS